MMKSIKTLYGMQIEASDGPIGHIKDFYFDEQSWAIRYVVADTGSWLPGRKVLISPHAFCSLHHAAQGRTQGLRADVTLNQIEKSPCLGSHKPVSREYEEEYHRYYGWPCYWWGGALWGISGLPLLGASAKIREGKQTHANRALPGRVDPPLRSTRAAGGFGRPSHEGETGAICDFMIDPLTWAIHKLAITTCHRFPDRALGLPLDRIAGMNWRDSTLFVSLAREHPTPCSQRDQNRTVRQISTSIKAIPSQTGGGLNSGRPDAVNTRLGRDRFELP
jgi:hypothetical protein